MVDRNTLWFQRFMDDRASGFVLADRRRARRFGFSVTCNRNPRTASCTHCCAHQPLKTIAYVLIRCGSFVSVAERLRIEFFAIRCGIV